MSPLLFDAFLRTLENDGLRTDVRDQARLHVVFSARRDWSVAAVRDTLRVLLTRDAGERAAFDRSFDAFFRQSLQCDREPRIDVTDMLAQLRSRLPDEAPASAPPVARPAVPARPRSGFAAEREPGWSAWRRRIAQPFRRLAERVRAIVDRVRDWLDDWRESHRPQEPPPSAEETIAWQVNVDRQTFSFASVGAPLEPMLTSRQIKRLADMLGFFRTDLAGRRLDVPATVQTA
nr:hypothetical protein [Pirellulaceae bacterium]